MLPKPTLQKLFYSLTIISLCLLSSFKLKSQNLPGYVPTSGLKAFYTFNGSAKDVSGNQNNGQVNGAQLAPDRFGLSNCAYYFDGNSSITVPSSPSNSSDITTNFSFACWYKLTSYFNGINSRFSPIIQKANGQGALGHQYKLYVQPFTQTGFWGNGFTGNNNNPASPVNLDTWYFIAATFDRGTIRYYVNGTLVKTQVFAVQSLSPTSDGDFEIGKDSPGDVEYLNGTLDDLGIWNRTLTQTEITSLYISCVNRDNIFTNDTLKVCSKSLMLDAGAGYTNYLWNNGSQNQTINANRSGWYQVSASRENCTARDSVYLGIVNGNIENNDTAVCLGQTLELFVDTIAILGNNYTWSTNQTTPTIQVTPTSNKTYYLSATNGITSCNDSINITVKLTSSSSNDVTSCDQYAWNGHTYTESGTYTFNAINADGCDSTATLHLTINRSTTSSTNISSCDSYSWNDQTYTESGTYTFNSTNAAGCDSTATLNLTINHSTVSNLSYTACDNYTWNERTFTESGIYYYTTNNAIGCDSIAALNLTINKNPETPTFSVIQPNPGLFSGSITITNPLSDGLQYSINNSNYQSQITFNTLPPGIYSITAKNNKGCISNIASAIINPALNAGIFDDDVNCSNFKSGNYFPLTQIRYSGSRGRITKVNPDEIIYYTLITAKSNSFTIDIVQSNSAVNFNSFAIKNGNQIRLSDLNCNRIATGASFSVGQGRILVTNAVPGNTYILSVKYDTETIVGKSYFGLSQGFIFNFYCKINGEVAFGSQASINLRLGSNCNNHSKLNPMSGNTEVNTTPAIDYFVYPNPTNHQFKLGEKINLSAPVDIIVMDVQGKVVLRKINCFINNNLGFGDNLQRGMYFIEIRSGNYKKVIKAEKL